MDLGLFADAVTQTRSRRADAPRPANDGLGQVAARLPMLDVSCNHGVSMQQSHLRRKVAETPAFERAVETRAVERAPLRVAVRESGTRMIQAFGLSIIGCIANFIFVGVLATNVLEANIEAR
ncbi:MAG: hypothetical protein QOF70_1781 [Acetobacteraceae bacterium]|jgi:hypothetical protein|nr:hypothetical protein [Acetobacteraceae bacterium]